MNVNHIINVMLARNEALNNLTQAKKNYSNERTLDTFNAMLSARSHYLSFTDQLYTFEVCSEIFEICKDSKTSIKKQITIDSTDDGYTLNCYLTENNLPILKLSKYIETTETIDS